MIMQLLDSFQTQVLYSSSNYLQNSLQDIVSNIQISSSFCIRHPNYKPLELPPEVVARFQKMPSDIQNKYLLLQLRNFLYGIYYNGSLQKSLRHDADSANMSLHQDLENNTFLGVDLKFYEQLHRSNCGNGYFDPGWSVVRQESDGSLAVIKGGLTLHIKREKHLQPSESLADIGDVVSILMPRNLVQNGFYMAVSNVGPRSVNHLDSCLQTVRIYFNFSPEGAIALMSSLTQKLNAIAIPFTFKVLYNPGDYGRYDSGVLYFEKNNYEVVRQVLQTVYTENKSYFQPEIPLFTKQLALGLGLAEEPDHKFETQESFGMNRCHIIANGLLEAWQKGDTSLEGRMNTILQHFSFLEIDLQHPYLNPSSQDVYFPLTGCKYN